MKKRWVILGSVMLLGAIGVITGEDEPVTKEEPKTEEVAKKEPVKKEKPAPEPKEKEPAPEPEKKGPSEELTKTYLKVLQDSYATTGKIEHELSDDGEYVIFKITPTDPDITVAFGMLAAGEMPREYWDTLTSNLLKISSTMGNDYAVWLMNPANPDLVLFSAIGGQTVSDFMEGK